MKINELISEIETTKAVESILVKHKNSAMKLGNNGKLKLAKVHKKKKMLKYHWHN